MKNKNLGFTLIELIVALALGLIITAAAMQLFMGGLITTKLQEAGAELQDSGIFGLEYMASEIRLANYGNISHPELNDQTTLGGIVLTSGTAGTTNLPLDGLQNAITAVGGVSNVDIKSDQLTILFIAPNRMFNCEGKEVQAGEYVIQRYFLRKDTSASNSTDYGLACDANKPPANSIAAITEFGGSNAGEIIMPRVDLVRFYLGTQSENKTQAAYYTIDEYLTTAKNARAASKKAPRIVSVKISVLVRSKDQTKSDLLKPSSEGTEQFAEGTVTLTDKTSTYMRREYTTTVALRNAMGEPL